MKILVFSDTHGSGRKMEEALALHKGTFDACVHLGDGTREFIYASYDYPSIPFIYVGGNGEEYSCEGYVREMLTEFGGKKVFLTHGHRYFVKYAKTNLIYAAQEKEADIVLYGHTHTPDNTYFNEGEGKPVYLFNPGSLTLPRNGRPSYGILEIKTNGVLFSIAEM